jgi:hypothetical protein
MHTPVHTELAEAECGGEEDAAGWHHLKIWSARSNESLIQRKSRAAFSLTAMNRTIGASCPLLSQSAAAAVSS